MKNIMLFACFYLLSCVSLAMKNDGEMRSKSEELTMYSKKDSYTVYKYEDSDLVQIAIVKYVTESKITFTLNSKNKRTMAESKIEGEAVSIGGDGEIDEDELGKAYFSIEYVYDKECWLAFRIDEETRNRLQVHEANCENHRKRETPFASKGIMYKEK